MSSSLSSSSSGCPSFVFHDCGRQAIGYDQGPLNGTNYPLVDPSADIRYLLADGYLAYEDIEQEYETPYRIAYMFGFGCLTSSPPAFAPTPTHSHDVLIYDKNDDVVFDSTIATYFTVDDWCDRMKIYEWRTDEAVCRLVVHTKWPTGGDIFPEPRNYDEHLTPESAVLDVRVVEKVPQRVLSLIVGVTAMSKTNIDITNGFNTEVTNSSSFDTDGGRRGERILISAEAGSGLGRFPACDESDIVIQRINGVRPTNPGDFFLAASGCYYVRQPETLFTGPPAFYVPEPATLKVGNDCGPCCDCEDFINVYNSFRKVYNDWNALGERAEDTRDQYSDNRDRWLENLACRTASPLDLAVQTSYCPCVSFGISFCPTNADCEGPLELTVTTETTSDQEPVPYNVSRRGNNGVGTTEPYAPGGEAPTFTFYWDAVQAGRVAKATGTFCFEDPEEANGKTLSLALSGTLGGVPITADSPITLVRSAIVDCGDGGLGGACSTVVGEPIDR